MRWSTRCTEPLNRAALSVGESSAAVLELPLPAWLNPVTDPAAWTVPPCPVAWQEEEEDDDEDFIDDDEDLDLGDEDDDDLFDDDEDDDVDDDEEVLDDE